MKAFGFALIICLFSTSLLQADTNVSPEVITLDSIYCETWADFPNEYDLFSRRGCCSWHEGVCGCSGGRITCCDGTLSPSCTCNKIIPPLDNTNI